MHPKEIQTKLSQTAERFNLKPFLKSIIHELSQGQKQKSWPCLSHDGTSEGLNPG